MISKRVFFRSLRFSSTGPKKPFQPAGISYPLFAKPEAPEKQWDNSAILPHPSYTTEELHNIVQTHEPPRDILEKVALLMVKTMRWTFDTVSGYRFGPITEAKLIRRIIFLETVAGVPGMVGGTIRHLRSLRKMTPDRGWIHTLIEEAENERMHMLTFLDLGKPGPLFRTAVSIVQVIFWNFFFVMYMISPRFCHSLVGYLEEEAVKTYTSAVEAVESGKLPLFAQLPPPPIAMAYWNMPKNSNMRDLLLYVRADEAVHRDVNHTFSRLEPTEPNPFIAKPEETTTKK